MSSKDWLEKDFSRCWAYWHASAAVSEGLSQAGPQPGYNPNNSGAEDRLKAVSEAYDSTTTRSAGSTGSCGRCSGRARSGAAPARGPALRHVPCSAAKDRTSVQQVRAFGPVWPDLLGRGGSATPGFPGPAVGAMWTPNAVSSTPSAGELPLRRGLRHFPAAASSQAAAPARAAPGWSPGQGAFGFAEPGRAARAWARSSARPGCNNRRRNREDLGMRSRCRRANGVRRRVRGSRARGGPAAR